MYYGVFYAWGKTRKVYQTDLPDTIFGFETKAQRDEWVNQGPLDPQTPGFCEVILEHDRRVQQAKRDRRKGFGSWKRGVPIYPDGH